MLASIFKGKDPGKPALRTCEVCGNEYDKTFEVRLKDGKAHVFDSFECAIHALAPTCAHCGCRVIGHGVEAGGVFYCCAHCADQQGVRGVQDRGLPEREQSRV
jgi:Rieske Fe-S protein